VCNHFQLVFPLSVCNLAFSRQSANPVTQLERHFTLQRLFSQKFHRIFNAHLKRFFVGQSSANKSNGVTFRLKSNKSHDGQRAFTNCALSAAANFPFIHSTHKSMLNTWQTVFAENQIISKFI